jgi:hypothetical protein
MHHEQEFTVSRHILIEMESGWTVLEQWLSDIFPVAAVAATIGLQWPLCINHTKKAVKFKYTFKLYQYFSHLGISTCFKHRHVTILIFSLL